MKKTLSKLGAVLLSVFVILNMLYTPLSVFAQEAEIAPTTISQEGEYLVINSAQDLKDIMNNSSYWDKKLKLGGDIDLSSIDVSQQKPIGNDTTPFSGEFEGNSKTIHNLQLNASSANYGFFGKIANGALVKNLTLRAPKLTDYFSGYVYSGGLGLFTGCNLGSLENCVVENGELVSGTNNSGGFIGYNKGTVTGCVVVNTTVKSNTEQTMGYIGGFAGYDNGGTISQSSVSGGFVTRETGSATKGKALGGFIGRIANRSSLVTQCYTTATVTSNSEDVGGFAGHPSNGNIEHSFSANAVTGSKYVGGFTGQHGGGEYTSCYTISDVTSTGVNNYFGLFYGGGILSASNAKNTFYSFTANITGNGTQKTQTPVVGKTTEEYKGLVNTLGADIWTQDNNVFSGYPTLVNLPILAGEPEISGPVTLKAPNVFQWQGTEVTWNTIEEADSYTVKVFRGEELLNTATDMKETSIDIAEFLTVKGAYKVSVQAVGDGEQALDSVESAKSNGYNYIPKDQAGFVLIGNAEDLLELTKANADFTANYRLKNNIDMSGITGKSIGGTTADKAFNGVFNGAGYQIKNLSLSGNGLFNRIGETGVVKNLTLVSPSIDGSNSPGALASQNDGTIENCHNIDGVVQSTDSVTGGLVGLNQGTITMSSVSGGNVHYTGTATKTGGFVGRNLGNIDQSYSTANVTGHKWVGGFVGAQEGGTISNSYTTGNLVATGGEVGGFAGFFVQYNSGQASNLKNVYASNDVSAESGGPLVGGNSTYSKAGEGVVTNSYYNGEKCAPSTEVFTPVGITEKTTEEMKTSDFASTLGNGDIWSIQSASDSGATRNSGFPYLTQVKPQEEIVSEEKTTVYIAVGVFDKETYQFKQSDPFAVTFPATQTGVTTVKDVLEAAKENELLTYEEEKNFITSMNGIALDGYDGWMFTVNDKVSSVGIGAAQLKTGDKLLWYQGIAANNYKNPAWAEIVSGPQTENYIPIETAQDLIDLSNAPEEWDKQYKMSADIDLSGLEIKPIGTENTPFTGFFHGNGFRISNMTINASGGYVGLFGHIQGAKVINMTLQNIDITGNYYVGGLVGKISVDKATKAGSLVANCHVQGKVAATGEVYIKQTGAGGLVGTSVGASKDGNTAFNAIDTCSTDVTLTSHNNAGNIGGLVGKNEFGNITNSFSKGTISGNNMVGGLVGLNYGGIYKSYSEVAVEGAQTVGGFVGSTGLGSTIEKCYCTGDVKATGSYGSNFGGFAGSISGTVKDSISSGTLSKGWSYNGGFAGAFSGTLYAHNDDLITLLNCYGNCIASDNSTLSAIGNEFFYTNDENNKNKLDNMQLNKEEAEQKLEEMITQWKKEEELKELLESELGALLNTATINNQTPASTDITREIFKKWDGTELNDQLSYSFTLQENGEFLEVADGNKLKLSKQNTGFENKKEIVIITLRAEEQIRELPVEVTLQGQVAAFNTEEVIESVLEKFSVEEYQNTQSDWLVFDHSAYSGKDNVFASKTARDQYIKASVENIMDNYATDYSRVSLMLTSLGIDASEYIDIMCDKDLVYTNEIIFALLAIDSGGYEVDSTLKDSYIHQLLTLQNTDGGWGWMQGNSDLDLTGFALTALSTYRDKAEVNASIEEGLTYLSNQQQDNGLFQPSYSWTGDPAQPDVHGSAAVVTALSALGIDANTDSRFVKANGTALSGLMSFVNQNKLFVYDGDENNEISNDQGVRALIAYDGFSKTNSAFNVHKFSHTLETINMNALGKEEGGNKNPGETPVENQSNQNDGENTPDGSDKTPAGNTGDRTNTTVYILLLTASLLCVQYMHKAKKNKG